MIYMERYITGEKFYELFSISIHLFIIMIIYFPSNTPSLSCSPSYICLL